jgi:hypothetical protein
MSIIERIVYICVFLVVCFVGIEGYLSVSLAYHARHHAQTNVDQAKQLAIERLAQTGGAEKVCAEADRLFKQLGTDRMTLPLDSQLAACPAIKSMARFVTVMPGYPPYLEIRIGDHWDSYLMVIPDTNSSYKFDKTASDREIIAGRVFVRK